MFDIWSYVCFCFFTLLVIDLIVSEAEPLCSIHMFIAAHMDKKFRFILSCVYCLRPLIHTRTHKYVHMPTKCAHADMCMRTVHLVAGLIPNIHDRLDRGIPSPKDYSSTRMRLGFGYICHAQV